MGSADNPLRIGAEKRFFEAVMLEPLMQPLEEAFGDCGALAGQGFSQLLAGMLQRAHD